MESFNKIKQEISEALSNLCYEKGDLTDIGNEIGIIIAKYFDAQNTKDDFLSGLEHGISLTDGSHDIVIEISKKSANIYGKVLSKRINKKKK